MWNIVVCVNAAKAPSGAFAYLTGAYAALTVGAVGVSYATLGVKQADAGQAKAGHSLQYANSGLL